MAKYQSSCNTFPNSASAYTFVFQDNCPRDDYKYYLKYTVTFLGGVPPGGVKFYKPGAVSRARFMGRALYCLLIAMFSNQFELTDEERTCVIEVSMYAVIAHLKPWFEANIPSRAPSIDLELVKKFEFELSRHKKNDARKTLWRTAGYRFLAHLWYLSPELVSLALFDDNGSDEDKAKIVSAMDIPTDTSDLPHKAFIAKLDKSVQNLQLCDFANEGSKLLFTKLGVEPDFLKKPPQDWKDDPSYQSLCALVNNLPLVNDAAERGVGLAAKFNNVLTKSESQKQGLYLVVAKD
ncbi:Divinyl chlorophyllide a 8-vinyl-reductase, chloroplastic [Frankliniella fusca]|uniref:Divinyl chlorophyllide a 8-vinyl-reductase, chloroplastic n=1 Tax=Frankliniella fusca TaxID=407009 RepID=A0AAE1HAV7_9NEOP|nr:Divinyl chlorophyllide a 8-vinyl-reductase, chloroplastic [Frankliniella fusca]